MAFITMESMSVTVPVTLRVLLVPEPVLVSVVISALVVVTEASLLSIRVVVFKSVAVTVPLTVRLVELIVVALIFSTVPSALTVVPVIVPVELPPAKVTIPVAVRLPATSFEVPFK